MFHASLSYDAGQQLSRDRTSLAFASFVVRSRPAAGRISSVGVHAYQGTKSPSVPSSNKRLKLIFDLDNTLLHAQATSKLPDDSIESFGDCLGRPECEIFTLPSAPGAYYYLKLRPFARELLEQIAPHFEMSIHTNATDEYAQICARILGPEYFGDRIAARVMVPGAHPNYEKDLLRLYPNEDDLQRIVILDDRLDVWTKSLRRNIVHSVMYNYFGVQASAAVARFKQKKAERTAAVPTVPSSSDASVSPPSESVKAKQPTPFLDAADASQQRQVKQGHEVLAPGAYSHEISYAADLDVQLAFLTSAMETTVGLIRSAAESGKTMDIREGMKRQMAGLLKGCVIMLCGFRKVVPVINVGNGQPTDFLSHYETWVHQLGGEVTSDGTREDVTHVVMIRNTPKADPVRERGTAHFVRPTWLLGTYQLRTRLPEIHFEFVQDCRVQPSLWTVYEELFTLILSLDEDQLSCATSSWLPKCVPRRTKFLAREWGNGLEHLLPAGWDGGRETIRDVGVV